MKLAAKVYRKFLHFLGLSLVIKRGVFAIARCKYGLQQGILTSFINDATRYGSFANISVDPKQMSDAQLLARLCMLAHGIEKGFSFRIRKSPFFVTKLPVFLSLFEEASRRNLIASTYQGDMSINALRAYQQLHADEDFLATYSNRIQILLNQFDAHPLKRPAVEAAAKNPNIDFDEFRAFFESRSSTRAFASRKVEASVIDKILECAIKTPSVCNRQPWRIKHFTDRTEIDQALSFQNGNRGFGHEAPGLLVIGCDLRCFFGTTERNESFVDSGLFAMSIILALHSAGIASCSLNWCVPPQKNQAFLDHFKLPPWFEVGMFLAYGYPFSEDVAVARSPRKTLNDLLL